MVIGITFTLVFLISECRSEDAIKPWRFAYYRINWRGLFEKGFEKHTTDGHYVFIHLCGIADFRSVSQTLASIRQASK